MLFLGKGNSASKDNMDAEGEEGELDVSYLSKWQASLPASIGRGDLSMSYDYEVLNQRSDPTFNQIHPKFSITKVFYPDDS